MGVALLVAAVLMVLTALNRFPGGGEALGLAAEAHPGLRHQLRARRADDARHRPLRALHDHGQPARDEPHRGVSDHDGLVRVPDADGQRRSSSARASTTCAPRSAWRSAACPAVLIAALHRAVAAAGRGALAGGRRGGLHRGDAAPRIGHRARRRQGARAGCVVGRVFKPVEPLRRRGRSSDRPRFERALDPPATFHTAPAVTRVLPRTRSAVPAPPHARARRLRGPAELSATSVARSWRPAVGAPSRGGAPARRAAFRRRSPRDGRGGSNAWPGGLKTRPLRCDDWPGADKRQNVIDQPCRATCALV